MAPDTGLVLARFAALVLALGLAGIPAYLALAGVRSAGRTLRVAIAVIVCCFSIASFWWAAASVAAMAAMPLTQLDSELLLTVLNATPLGKVLAVKLVAAASLLWALLFSQNLRAFALIAFPGLASFAWTGHSGSTDGTMGVLQRSLDILHLSAAAIWVGALCVFLTSLFAVSDRSEFTRRLEAFAKTGTVVVSTLALTGMANAYIISRSGWSIHSEWTYLLGAKIVLFFAMLGFAGLNRWFFAPAYLHRKPGSEYRLTISLALESIAALSILLLVANLGFLDPSASG